jgi:hypothetical protein
MKALKPNTQQDGRAGEHYVAAELNRRGAYGIQPEQRVPVQEVLYFRHLEFVV